ncbi:MAG: diacylglycerol kinase family protein [Clostridia bacterium]|nr:diacylglycerol kinase family protein [Clostridia bacterium]
MKNKTLYDSLHNSWDGLKYTFKTQRNMKVHLSLGIAAMLLCWLLKIDLQGTAQVIFAISFVLFAETVNTAIEKTVDLFMSTYHPLAKIAKNVAAGAVLIASINAVIVGGLVFIKPLLMALSKIF